MPNPPPPKKSPEPKSSTLPPFEPHDPFKTHIADNAKTAAQQDERDANTVRIYVDGSVHDGKAGAAAVLLRKNREPRVLRLHLGSDDHLINEAEHVGQLLGLHLLRTERKASKPVSMACDNQSAIRALQQPEHIDNASQREEAVRKLASEFARVARETKKGRRMAYSLLVRWVPGHDGVEGNEMADVEAAKAAEGDSSPDAELPAYLVKKYRDKQGAEAKPRSEAKPKKQ